jgi:hypothetical protein
MFKLMIPGVLLLATAATLLTPSTGDAQYPNRIGVYSTTNYGQAGTGDTQYPVYYHGYARSPGFAPHLSPAYGPELSAGYSPRYYVPNANAPVAYVPYYPPVYVPYSTQRRWGR